MTRQLTQSNIMLDLLIKDASLFRIGRVLLYAAGSNPVDVRELKHQVSKYYLKQSRFSYKIIKNTHKQINYLLDLYIDQELFILINNQYYITPKGSYMKELSEEYA